ncbi:MBL fold metallo-hydrolase [Acetobacterium fimetarium]|uniref:MBL fold metallo-hydrolase n=1 Tax=Acetobacterium fimetarium TaxID=52691 RepID=A0ABR6WQK4_9FIRM|nr:MBL fold metallo-hydrolase [Acetobacterium fimetarium]MBC3802902.1 MBL fold metallo-hydrolase [Acetobacterium fimetarium]
MTKIYDNLFQFTDYIQPYQLSLHQYLLLTEEPILIHTGTVRQSKAVLPKIKELLGDRTLKFIFVSHFESDECGGLSVYLKSFPDVITVCSEITARQLCGFGYTGKAIPKKNGETLIGNDFAFTCVGYPSEIHLQDGLLFMEHRSGIFFSSDLMFRFGDAHGQKMDSNWQEEVSSIGLERVASPERLSRMKAELLHFSPEFIAVGHGPCVNLQ